MGVWAFVDFVLGVGMVSWVVLIFIKMSGRRGMAILMAYGSLVWLGQRYVLAVLSFSGKFDLEAEL